MDIRTAQTTGQSGAVRWFSTSSRASVVSAATTDSSTRVAAKNCASVIPLKPRRPLCHGPESSFVLSHVTNRSAAYQPPRSISARKFRVLL